MTDLTPEEAMTFDARTQSSTGLEIAHKLRSEESRLYTYVGNAAVAYVELTEYDTPLMSLHDASDVEPNSSELRLNYYLLNPVTQEYSERVYTLAPGEQSLTIEQAMEILELEAVPMYAEFYEALLGNAVGIKRRQLADSTAKAINKVYGYVLAHCALADQALKDIQQLVVEACVAPYAELVKPASKSVDLELDLHELSSGEVPTLTDAIYSAKVIVSATYRTYNERTTECSGSVRIVINDGNEYGFGDSSAELMECTAEDSAFTFWTLVATCILQGLAHTLQPVTRSS